MSPVLDARITPMFTIETGMTLVSKRRGVTSTVVGCTAYDYLVETDGHIANLNSVEIYTYFRLA